MPWRAWIIGIGIRRTLTDVVAPDERERSLMCSGCQADGRPTPA